MGTSHTKNFLKGARGKIHNGVLTAICDIDEERFKFFDNPEYDKTGITFFTDAETMFKSGLCDVVMICTPHYSHPDLAILAMDNNLHCIVEKPAGVYTLQVQKMIERSKKSDKILGIMFNQRTLPEFKN
jgi:predicted dehydrogenase